MTGRLRRRDLLVRGGAGLGAGTVMGAAGGAAATERAPHHAPAAPPQPADEPDDDVSTWAGVRRQFALEPGKAHFTSFLLASHPAPVRRAVEEHRRGLDANPRDYLNEHELRLEEEVLGAAADYLGPRPRRSRSRTRRPWASGSCTAACASRRARRS